MPSVWSSVVTYFKTKDSVESNQITENKNLNANKYVNKKFLVIPLFCNTLHVIYYYTGELFFQKLRMKFSFKFCLRKYEFCNCKIPSPMFFLHFFYRYLADNIENVYIGTTHFIIIFY